MDNPAKRWAERASYDLATARAMLASRRYLYVAFMCQQSLEKLLKAIVIAHKKEVLRTHNLVRLAETAEVYGALPAKDQDFLADLTPFAIESRYGDYRERLSEIVNRKQALAYLKKTAEVFRWLRKKIRK